MQTYTAIVRGVRDTSTGIARSEANQLTVLAGRHQYRTAAGASGGEDLEAAARAATVAASNASGFGLEAGPLRSARQTNIAVWTRILRTRPVVTQNPTK
jgi:hypothetical protein